MKGCINRFLTLGKSTVYRSVLPCLQPTFEIRTVNRVGIRRQDFFLERHISFNFLTKFWPFKPSLRMNEVFQLGIEIEPRKEDENARNISDDSENIEKDESNFGESTTNAGTSKVNNLGEEIGEKFSRKVVRKRKKVNPKNLHQTFKRPKISSEEVMTQTKYYFENGLRKVIPYDHQFNTFCKGRWLGKTLREIYTKEFRLYPVEYYEKAVKDGRLMVNFKKPKSLDTVTKSNDLLTSIVHRHECPVTDDPIEIIADDQNFFVVNKPSSIPLHPGGRFRHNTILSILAKEYNKKDIHSLHRLDRMTSGLLLFATNRETAIKIHKNIREREVEKEYVCRVVGDFSKFELPPNTDAKVLVKEDIITVTEPIEIYDRRIGTSIVSHSEKAKDCETSFKCLSTNGKTSVVSCRPKTGRTHQIRVHIQFLGYPIINDPVYNSPAWGDERYKFGPITKPMDEVMRELSNMKKWATIMESFNKTLEKDDSDKPDREEEVNEPEPVCEISKDELKIPDEENMSNVNEKQIMEDSLDGVKDKDGIVAFRANCEECKNALPDPKPDELVMYLHALRYKGPDWEFKTELPSWANSEWTEKSLTDET